MNHVKNSIFGATLCLLALGFSDTAVGTNHDDPRAWERHELPGSERRGHGNADAERLYSQRYDYCRDSAGGPELVDGERQPAIYYVFPEHAGRQQRAPSNGGGEYPGLSNGQLVSANITMGYSTYRRAR